MHRVAGKQLLEFTHAFCMRVYVCCDRKSCQHGISYQLLLLPVCGCSLCPPPSFDNERRAIDRLPVNAAPSCDSITSDRQSG